MVLGNISAVRFYTPYYCHRLLDLQVLQIIPRYFTQYPLLNKPDKAESGGEQRQFDGQLNDNYCIEVLVYRKSQNCFE